MERNMAQAVHGVQHLFLGVHDKLEFRQMLLKTQLLQVLRNLVYRIIRGMIIIEVHMFLRLAIWSFLIGLAMSKRVGLTMLELLEKVLFTMEIM